MGAAETGCQRRESVDESGWREAQSLPPPPLPPPLHWERMEKERAVEVREGGAWS